MKTMIEKAWDDRALLEKNEYTEAVREVVRLLDQGELRAAEPVGEGWQVNEWVKKAVLLYFPSRAITPSVVSAWCLTPSPATEPSSHLASS